MKKISLQQGSDLWLEFRRTRIGASDLPIIVGESPYMTVQSLWEEKLLFRSPQIMSYYMQRGVDLESTARGLICDVMGYPFDPCVIQHDKVDYLIASLDGLNEDAGVICEIKCPGMKTHLMAINGEIPAHYQWQIEHQFLVSGLKDCLYVSYNPDHTEKPLIIIERSVNLELHNFILEKTKEFWECLQSITPPPKKERKNKKRETEG
jgi:putative phage-type endonuclease